MRHILLLLENIGKCWILQNVGPLKQCFYIPVCALTQPFVIMLLSSVHTFTGECKPFLFHVFADPHANMLTITKRIHTYLAGLNIFTTLK